MSEEDHYLGITLRQSQVEDSKCALMFQHLWRRDKALEILTNILQDVEDGIYPNAPRSEIDMWTTHWEDCCKILNQWELLAEFALVNQKPDLLLQASWKLGDWVLIFYNVINFLVHDERSF